MEEVARDFLQPLGIDHWKNNMGPRPPGGPSDDQLKGLAETANEIGMRTKKYGVRLSLHPHMWGPMEREHDFRYVMAHTDPNYVYLIMDTGHNVLGGMDVVKMTEEFFPRITEFHLKDTFPQYRGNKAGPTPEQHKQKSVYAAVGQGGGVDFPGVFAVMRKKRFKGWAVFDIDAPRPGDGTGTVDDNIAASVNYLRTKLGVKLPAATGKGLFKDA
jgi:inosose dehydratase